MQLYICIKEAFMSTVNSHHWAEEVDYVTNFPRLLSWARSPGASTPTHIFLQQYNSSEINYRKEVNQLAMWWLWQQSLRKCGENQGEHTRSLPHSWSTPAVENEEKIHLKSVMSLWHAGASFKRRGLRDGDRVDVWGVVTGSVHFITLKWQSGLGTLSNFMMPLKIIFTANLLAWGCFCRKG